MRLDLKVQGEKVRLVPYMPRHVPRYHEWMKDPYLLEMTASEPLSLEEEFAMQVTWREDPTKATFILFVHPFDDRDEQESEMAGDVNLFFNDDEDNTNCEIDIMVAETKWRGHGIGTEAVQLMMAYAVKNFQASRIYCKIHETNAASLGLFKKLGYTECNYVSAFKEYELEFVINEQRRAELTERLLRAKFLPCNLENDF